MQTIVDKVLSRIKAGGKGRVYCTKDFLDLGSHQTIRKIMSRQEKEGGLRRILRGVYDYPAHSPVLDGPASPDPDGIARAIARAHGWVILPSGATALNMLGLSSQVPAQWQYFSDGPSRKYRWEGGSLSFVHRANKETSALSPRTALVVQALKTLGRDAVGDDVVSRLRSALDADELARAVKESRYVTAWVYEVIKRVAKETGVNA